jgi:hypothetical protein
VSLCGTAARFAVAAIGVHLAFGETRAVADVSKDRCVDANTAAQSMRRRAHFADVRAALKICGDPSCPSIVRSDCAERLDELNRAQPTVILDAKDPEGNDLGEVKLTVDGVVIAERLNGGALDIDPGEHTFLFEAPGRSSLTRTFVLKEGEKNRLEHIVLQAPTAAEGTKSPEEAPEGMTAPRSGGLSGRKIVGLVVAGVGVAGLATGTVLGLDAAAAYSDQKRDCGSPATCPNHAQAVSDHSTMNTDGTWSTVAFVAGAACVAGAAWLFFGDTPTPSRASTGLAVVPAIGRSGAGFVVRTDF